MFCQKPNQSKSIQFDPRRSAERILSRWLTRWLKLAIQSCTDRILKRSTLFRGMPIVSMDDAMIQTLPIMETAMTWSIEGSNSDDTSASFHSAWKCVPAKNPVAMTPPYNDDAFTSENPSMSQHSMPANRRGYPISDDIDDEGDRWRRFCR
jgi:hypothetical protein